MNDQELRLLAKAFKALPDIAEQLKRIADQIETNAETHNELSNAMISATYEVAAQTRERR